jgi:acetate kinase
LRAIFQQLDAHGPKVATIGAVAHRVAHGADLYTQATPVTAEVIAAIEHLSPLAPRHNPTAAQAIRAAQRLLPKLPHVAIFDTAFFADLPAEATIYALPREWLERFHIRKYGFHGTTHRYIAEQLTRIFGRDDLRQITCYLGRGYSLAAIDSGRPIDVSGGFTTVEGLPMRSRSGSIAPGLHRCLMERLNLSAAEFARVLNDESGFFGLSGQADPMALWPAYDEGEHWARLAIDQQIHRLVHQISAFHGLLGGAHVIAFTGTTGENDWRLREAVCQRLAPLGVDLDPAINAKTRGDVRSRILTHPHSNIHVVMVHDRDSLVMARQTAAALGWRKAC